MKNDTKQQQIEEAKEQYMEELHRRAEEEANISLDNLLIYPIIGGIRRLPLDISDIRDNTEARLNTRFDCSFEEKMLLEAIKKISEALERLNRAVKGVKQ